MRRHQKALRSYLTPVTCRARLIGFPPGKSQRDLPGWSRSMPSQFASRKVDCSRLVVYQDTESDLVLGFFARSERYPELIDQGSLFRKSSNRSLPVTPQHLLSPSATQRLREHS